MFSCLKIDELKLYGIVAIIGGDPYSQRISHKSSLQPVIDICDAKAFSMM